MSVKHDDYEVHAGLTTNVTVTQAKEYRVAESRRATLAFHQVPTPANTFKADIIVYGAVKDEDAWYAQIATKSLSTASESVDHIDLSTINPGRALRFIKVVIANLSGGTLDVHLATSRY